MDLIILVYGPCPWMKNNSLELATQGKDYISLLGISTLARSYTKLNKLIQTENIGTHIFFS